APMLTRGDQEVWLRRLAADHNNLRAALDWLVGQGDATRALRLGGALWRFWYVRGHLSEGRRWLESALALGGQDAMPERLRALVGAGYLAWAQGDFDRAAALFDDAMALARQRGDRSGVAEALDGLGRVASYRGDAATARAMYGQAIAIHQELGDRWGAAKSLYFSGVAAAIQGADPAALPLLTEAREMFREVHDLGGIADSTGMLGLAALGQGDDVAARSLVEEAHAMMRDLGDRPGAAQTLSVLGHIVFGQGQHISARALYGDALAILADLDDRWWLAWCLEGLAAIAAVGERPTQAAKLLGSAKTLRDAINAPQPPIHRASYERTVRATRAALGQSAFADAWEAGRALPAEKSVAEAGEFAAGRGGDGAEAGGPSRSTAFGLTPREQEVLRLLAAGRTDCEIADALYVSPRTIHSHVAHLLHKLGVGVRTEAAAVAIRHGLV
ncbi:MAG: tetratricopeptide repeat protein, partial [Thermomicrobiales bacterium]